MKFLRIIIAFNLIGAQVLKAMDLEEDKAKLPQEILLGIINAVHNPSDLWKFFLVSKDWNRALAIHISVHPKHILNMSNWTIEELNNVLKNFAQDEKILLRNLALEFVTELPRMEITNPKQLASFFIAYSAVCISVPRGNAYNVAQDAGKAACEIAGKVAGDEACFAAEQSAQRSDKTYAWDAILEVSASFEKALEAAREDDQKTTKDAIKNTIDKIKDHPAEKLGIEAWQLSNLHVLALISQEKFGLDCPRPFKDNYNSALMMLQKNRFSLSADELMKLIAAPTWDRIELNKNPYIVSLKPIMLDARCYVLDAQQL